MVCFGELCVWLSSNFEVSVLAASSIITIVLYIRGHGGLGFSG